MYILVEFTEQKEISVVSSNWVSDNNSVWPPFKSSSRMRKAIEAKMIPGDDWEAYPVRELYRNESYQKVRSKLREAELRSDLETPCDSESEEESFRTSKRRKTKSSRLMSSSDEDSASEKTVKEVVFGRNPPKPTGPPKALDITLPVPPSSNARDASYNTLPQATFAANSLISSRPLSPFTSPRTTTSTSTPPDDRQSSFRGLRDVNHVRDARLFMLLEQIKKEQADQREMLGTILHHLQKMPVSENSSTESSSLPETINFPIESIEELDELEKELAVASVEASVVYNFSLYSGKNTADTVRRILKRTMKSQLAEKFNWYGKKGKKEFGKLKLAAVIYKAVKKTLKNVTEAEVEGIVREWLRTASDREGGRKRRREATQQIVTAEPDV
ncbi:uncharacterized protein LOC132725006 [Ruditapes philippinarum]|uniref:uncharacterized protein LOC132725006 n=1 Tax=Ruditapes philippinarum TaxID=129788 RepID=UPI00295AEAD0|nr:uncharacterized protein LOC132725006 [Ruditapes philippinarum]